MGGIQAQKSNELIMYRIKPTSTRRWLAIYNVQGARQENQSLLSVVFSVIGGLNVPLFKWAKETE
jgi:hypothetical protein